MTFQVFVCCRKCSFREQGEPYIWHVENHGIICPNCNNPWATEEDYQFRKRLDKLWDLYNPTVTFDGTSFQLSPEVNKIKKQIDEEFGSW